MNTEKAIKLLHEMQEAWKLQITGDAFDALEMAITALDQLNNNSTKPDNSTATQFNAIKTHVKGMTACRVSEVAKDTNVLNNDTISRAEAIDEITEYGSGDAIFMSVGEFKRRIEHLPPVQPEPH